MEASSLVTWERYLAEVIRQEIFPPPQVSRIFAYAHVAAYEALLPVFPGNQTFSGQLNGLEQLPEAPEAGHYDAELAALTAYLLTARSFVYDEERIDRYHRQRADSLSLLINDERTVANSLAHGEKIARHVIEWAGTDMFRETRSMTRHTLGQDGSAWIPTPPAFAAAFEPHWNLIRPFVVDTSMISHEYPIPAYSKDTASAFHKEAMEVYWTSQALSDEFTNTAWYWDDNPNTTIHSGHVMLKVQKHSPASHWMIIAAQASLDRGDDAVYTAQTLAITAMAMHDAFVHCWHGKYKHNLLRPVTYINRYIDPDWQSLIQTPPFPECPSGHSTISRAAAVVLTERLGKDHRFTDPTEEQFGLGIRTYPSFIAAAEEAKMSRLYGGIHYPFGNEIGAALGDTVGRTVIEKIQLR